MLGSGTTYPAINAASAMPSVRKFSSVNTAPLFRVNALSLFRIAKELCAGLADDRNWIEIVEGNDA